MFRKLLAKMGFVPKCDFEAVRATNVKLNKQVTDYRSRACDSYPLDRKRLKVRLGKRIIVTGIFVLTEPGTVLLKSVKHNNIKVANHIWLKNCETDLHQGFNGHIVEVEGFVYKYLTRTSNYPEQVSMQDVVIRVKGY